MSTPTKPSIVFAHGIWADGSCFNKLIPSLQAEGHEVISAQYGLNSNVEDVAATVRYFGRVSSPIDPGRPLLRRSGHHRRGHR